MNYKILDPLMGLAAGAIVSTAVFYIIPSGWHMAVGMIAGGILGMVLSIPLAASLKLVLLEVYFEVYALSRK